LSQRFDQPRELKNEAENSAGRMPAFAFSFKRTVGRGDPPTACDFLAKHSDLAKGRIKDAMNKGAVWLQRQKGGTHRIRRATAALRPGDVLSIFYNAKLLRRTPPAAECLHDRRRYSVWFKPAGLMTQGTRYGDHCALLRQVELAFKLKRKVFLVHRLDREASGVVLIAHDHEAAGRLSRLFQTQQIVKRYRAQVRGNPPQETLPAIIDLPLDGRRAITEYTVVGFNPESNIAKVDVSIRTGRTHQIRRHFDLIGHPLMGDPRYGTKNKTSDGLKLTATALEFRCPFTAVHLALTVHPKP
jgi:tRNA pseudouridine32 synthase/23S rRNA pseudouridine746 synthase